MLALSLTFVLTGATVQHQALLTRQMRFPVLAVIDVSSAAIRLWPGLRHGLARVCLLGAGGAATGDGGLQPYLYVDVLGMASALAVAQQRSASHWSALERTSASPISSASSRLTATASCSGASFGAVPLGLYTRAQVLLARPIQQVVTPINNVLIPVLSRLQNDPTAIAGAICGPMARWRWWCSRLPHRVWRFRSRWFWSSSDRSGRARFRFSRCLLWSPSRTPLSAICSWIYESQGRGKDQLTEPYRGRHCDDSFVCGWAALGSDGRGLLAGHRELVVRLPIVYYIAGRSGPVQHARSVDGFPLPSALLGGSCS